LARRLRRHVARTGSAQMLVVRYGVQLMLTMLRRLLLGSATQMICSRGAERGRGGGLRDEQKGLRV
jgi:hypothetical protein